MPRTPEQAGRQSRRGRMFLSQVVAENVKSYRGMRGLSQGELGARLGALNLVDEWDQTIVSRVERGTRNVTVDEIAALALVLDVPFPKLFDPAGPDDTRSVELDFGAARGTLEPKLARAWLWGDVRLGLTERSKGGVSLRVEPASRPATVPAAEVVEAALDDALRRSKR